MLCLEYLDIIFYVVNIIILCSHVHNMYLFYMSHIFVYGRPGVALNVTLLNNIIYKKKNPLTVHYHKTVYR